MAEPPEAPVTEKKSRRKRERSHAGSGAREHPSRAKRRQEQAQGAQGPVYEPLFQPAPPLPDPPPVPAQPPLRRVLLTGASGFVGREVMRQLLAAEFQVVAVSRAPRPAELPHGVIWVTADITGDGWARWCEGCTSAIHLVGIIREAPRRRVSFERLHTELTLHLLRICAELDIHRFVHMPFFPSPTEILHPPRAVPGN